MANPNVLDIPGTQTHKRIIAGNSLSPDLVVFSMRQVTVAWMMQLTCWIKDCCWVGLLGPPGGTVSPVLEGNTVPGAGNAEQHSTEGVVNQPVNSAWEMDTYLATSWMTI
jgi:hypothetical protein